MKKKIWRNPLVGIASGPYKAAQPLGYESKLWPAKSMFPGRWTPARGKMLPKKANWQIRPCFNSMYLNRSKFSWSPSATIWRGSKKLLLWSKLEMKKNERNHYKVRNRRMVGSILTIFYTERQTKIVRPPDGQPN